MGRLLLPQLANRSSKQPHQQPQPQPGYHKSLGVPVQSACTNDCAMTQPTSLRPVSLSEYIDYTRRKQWKQIPAHFTNSLLSFQGLPLRDVVAGHVALRPRLPVFRVPPVALLSTDDVEKVPLPKG